MNVDVDFMNAGAVGKGVFSFGQKAEEKASQRKNVTGDFASPPHLNCATIGVVHDHRIFPLIFISLLNLLQFRCNKINRSFCALDHLVAARLRRRFGKAKIVNFKDYFAISTRLFDEHIGRFDVPVNKTFGVDKM